MARAIGNQIRAICEASEHDGAWLKAYELFVRAGMQRQPTLATNVCKRAVEYGLMECDASMYPMRFKVVHGWKYLIEKAHVEPKPAVRKMVNKPKKPIINSVWSLGL